MAASVATLGTDVSSVVRRCRHVLVDRVQARRVATFFGPMVLFVIVSLLLGLYVATRALSHLRHVVAGRIPARDFGSRRGLAAAIFFYFVLEVGFQVPLLKGPLEAALGLY